jgi:2-oxoglutarate dehydrogenase E1 component
VLHVNADDAEAVVHAVEMALDYRMRFKKDVYIDLLGYRKYGHNEGDEPRFTQPKLYKNIAKHDNPFKIYSEKLITEQTIDKNYSDAIVKEFKNTLEKEYEKSKEAESSKVREFMQERWKGFTRKGVDAMLTEANTAYPEDRLKAISKITSTVPEGVKFVRKAERILRGRDKMVFEDNKLDWGMAETLAYGSLLEEGYNVRMRS